MRFFKHLITEPLKIIGTLALDVIVPKDNRLFVYGSALSKYGDNSRFLFEYGLKNEPGIKHVWITSDKKIFNGLSRKFSKDNVVYSKSIKGLFTILRAKIIIVSNCFDDVYFKHFSKNLHNVINLWHGIPMKKLGLLDKSRNMVDKIYFRFFSRSYSAFTTCSDNERNNIIKCWGLKDTKVVVTGYPRNDVLFRPEKKLINHLNIDKFKKIILYAPTWRLGKNIRFFPFDDFDIDDLNRFLKKKGIILLLRAHLADFLNDKNSNKLLSRIRHLSNIDILNQKKICDVNEILPFVDILITDYSGIYFDFLLLEKPVIFFPYDLKEYSKIPGLLFDYNKIIAGPKVFKYVDFISWIDKFSKKPSIFKNERIAAKNSIHKFQDDKSSERVYAMIKKKFLRF